MKPEFSADGLSPAGAAAGLVHPFVPGTAICPEARNEATPYWYRTGPDGRNPMSSKVPTNVPLGGGAQNCGVDPSAPPMPHGVGIPFGGMAGGLAAILAPQLFSTITDIIDVLIAVKFVFASDVLAFS